MSWFDRPILFVTAPLAKGFLAVRDRVRSVFHRYFFLIGVEKENESLRSEIGGLESKELFLNDLEKENARLRSVLVMRERLKGEWVGARVVSYPPISPYRILTIDKGSEEGVRRRAAVVSSDGLVGQVTRVFGHYSQVLLITDPTSAVDGSIDQTNSRGLVVGKVLKMRFKTDVYVSAFDYLSQSTEMNEGALVVTSGLDGIFPAGIPIGTVHGGQKKKYDIFQQAEVIPSVDFYKLREVLVIQ